MGVDVRHVDGNPSDLGSCSPAARTPSRLVGGRPQGGADRVRGRRSRSTAGPRRRRAAAAALPIRPRRTYRSSWLPPRRPPSASFVQAPPCRQPSTSPTPAVVPVRGTSASSWSDRRPGRPSSPRRRSPCLAPCSSRPWRRTPRSRVTRPGSSGSRVAPTFVASRSGFVSPVRDSDPRLRPSFARRESMPATRGASRLLPRNTDTRRSLPTASSPPSSAAPSRCFT